MFRQSEDGLHIFSSKRNHAEESRARQSGKRNKTIDF